LVHAQPLHTRYQFLALWTAGLNRLAADRLRVCRKLALVVSGLTKIYGTCIKFVRVNIHDPKTAALQTQLGFMTTPEFFLLDPGDGWCISGPKTSPVIVWHKSWMRCKNRARHE